PFVSRERSGPRDENRPRPGARPFVSRERSGSRDEGRPRREWRPREDRGQAGAVNRSRPAYAEAPARTRWRRDGKPSPATPPPWRRSPPAREGAPPSRRREGFRPADEPGAPLPSDPREAALRILHAVDSRGAFSDRLLDGAHARAGSDPRDAALLHELVKGTLRWRGRLDWALDQRVHIGLAAVQPWIRNVLRLGAYQILMLDRIPPHAAVDESVKLAHVYGHPGAAGLVNSVLRRLVDEKDTMAWPTGDDAASLAIWGSHPQWMVERWLARFGAEETRALLVANNRAVRTGLRVNSLRGTRDQLIDRLAAEGVVASPGRLSPDLVWVEGHHAPGALQAFRDGWCTAQDESEALVGRVVAPRPNERLLDLCAAPGGKSTHLAELIGDEGEVWAMERDVHRVASLEATIARLGEHAIHVVHGDGRTYAFPMPFDRVLVDAPCSGMGVLARRADARWRKGLESLAELPPVQLALLDSAAGRLVPGGTLVYSVCSFEPEENERVIERFLSSHPGFTLESVAGLVPDGVVTPEGYLRVLPQQHGCDGAFAARMRRA
ncbi:MAG TPA: 16S rRNA (cytosine(967)-C(5))-methyltransferase RsmB, partial [Candidatus Acidoferrales bacterium]|nr:16S rRNA (cytosine(967)-C(5))-methyltransferase RsmB [Candidatus Acidoferrales bacterium]